MHSMHAVYPCPNPAQIERLTTYADAERTTPLCVLELFSRRKDRLARRQTWLGPGQQRTILSSFEPGAASCLTSVCMTRGGMAAPGSLPRWEVDLRFCSDSRPDGLLRWGGAALPGPAGAAACSAKRFAVVLAALTSFLSSCAVQAPAHRGQPGGVVCTRQPA